MPMTVVSMTVQHPIYECVPQHFTTISKAPALTKNRLLVSAAITTHECGLAAQNGKYGTDNGLLGVLMVSNLPANPL
jgi:hypothetical protein